MLGFASAKRSCAAIALLVCLGAPSWLLAGFTSNPINLSGDTVEYQNLVESTNTNGSLFGVPSLIEDDTIVFTPTSFIHSSPNGPLSNIIDSQIRFTLVAKPGEVIPLLKLEEEGLVSLGLSGNPTPADFATAMVGMPILFHILEIDGVSVFGPSGHVNMVFTSAGMFNLANGPLDDALWTGEAILNFDDIILNDPLFAGRATKVEITFDNSLATAAFGNTFASIQKNKLKISVPEVSSSLLVALAGVALTTARLTRGARAKKEIV